MISYLRGILDHKEPERVIIDVNGIGYEVFIPLSTYEKLPPVGNQVKLYTHHYIRQDVMYLYGFLSQEEKETFELVLSISGIGAKGAINILSTIEINDFRRAIAQSDIKTITKVPGIGKKSAERMVLELKDKVGKISPEEQALRFMDVSVTNDAVAALLTLGTSQSLAEFAVYKAERKLGKEARLEDIITEAIRSLGR